MAAFKQIDDDDDSGTREGCEIILETDLRDWGPPISHLRAHLTDVKSHMLPVPGKWEGYLASST